MNSDEEENIKKLIEELMELVDRQHAQEEARNIIAENPYYDSLDPFSAKTINEEEYYWFEGTVFLNSWEVDSWTERRKQAEQGVEAKKAKFAADNRFMVLYYPYATIYQETTIKNLILYFDKIYVISDGGVPRFGDIIGIIHPMEFRNREYIELFEHNLRLDLEDNNFSRLLRGHEHDVWELLEAKGMIFESILRSRSDQVPFPEGESLLLSMSLAACQRYNLVPITDDPLHHQFLKARLQRVANDTRVIDELQRHRIRQVRRTRSAQFAVEVLRETIPDLDCVPIDGLLEFRETHRTELERFRLEMARLSAIMQCEIWDDNFEQRILDTIDQEIKPKLMELKNELEELRIKTLSKGLSSFQSLSEETARAGIPFIASLFAGLPIEAAFGIGTGALILSRLVEYYAEKRNIRKQNALTYLFDLTQVRRRRRKR